MGGGMGEGMGVLPMMVYRRRIRHILEFCEKRQENLRVSDVLKYFKTFCAFTAVKRDTVF